MGCALAQAPQDDPHAALVGKTAPEFKAEFALNGKTKSLADLKGKVVLLDFWAVWSGPCYRNFPNVREWHDKYTGKGLVIVGITRYHRRCGFDKEKGKLTNVTEDLTDEQEQEMLKDFTTYHKLDHLQLMVFQQDPQKLYEKYSVRAIPTTVLIDKQGKVRLVKVGADEANVKAVEETIQTLIAE